MATNSDALANALQHHQAGELQAAEAIYRQILAENPDHASALHQLGVVAFQVGKHEAAIDLIRRAIEVNGNESTFHNSLGRVYTTRGKLDGAIACYREAIELKPDCAEAHYNLGTALSEQGRLDEAIESYRQAIELKPAFLEALFNLGNAYKAQGKLAEAVGCFRQQLQLQPNLPETHTNLGTVFQAQGNLNEAVASYRRALVLQPDHARTHNNLGAAWQALGKLDHAAACFRRALELEPEYADAHSNQSTLMLLRGDFQRGWPEYEWRWKTGQLLNREFSQPRWAGEPLGDRAILLHAEQGFGDTFQFVRYAAVIKKQNVRATVILGCQRPLEKVLAKCPGIDRMVAEGGELSPFDVHAPLLSLPGILETTAETIPANVPYLFAESGLVAHWRERLSNVTGLKIGINWQGRSGQGEFRQRDIPLDHFIALAELPGVSLVSLNKGGRDGLAGASVTIFDPGPDFDTVHGAFMDTAAVMMNLDLVITSDTSIPHLAGALGIPVWLALPFVPEWRWLLGRSDSPWYPTMRLFRQKSPGDWAGVFEEIRGALNTLVPRAT